MKILVIGPSWVGDMMISQGLYRTLKAIHPKATIDVVAPRWSLPLLERMPEVNQGIELPIEHGQLAWSKRYQLGKQLRQEGYQQAYVLPNSFKSALIPWLAKIPVRIGWKGEMRYGLLTDIRHLEPNAFPLMLERYIALSYPGESIRCAADLPKPLLWPKLRVTDQEIAEVKAAFNLTRLQPLIGFCPGAEFGPAKQWPDFHYAVLAQSLINLGYQIALFGSAKDHLIGEAICQLLPAANRSSCHNLAGKTSLGQAILLLAGCRAVVSNDSGLMHIAASLDRPLVALYGPSSPDFTPPLTHNAQVIRLISGYHKVRKGDAKQGYHHSLIAIKPDRVLETLLPLLNQDNQ